LLWFISSGAEVQYFPYDDSSELRDRAIRAMAEALGVDEDAVRKNPNIWREMGADSLDLVELIMELEEEREIT
jgi:acyl carrier protein